MTTLPEAAQTSILLVCFCLAQSTALLLTVPTDSGIYIENVAFEGRARWGATFGGYTDTDVDGHGTHCAGTAVSGPYGVAKKADVIAVRVLADNGDGTTADM